MMEPPLNRIHMLGIEDNFPSYASLCLNIVCSSFHFVIYIVHPRVRKKEDYGNLILYHYCKRKELYQSEDTTLRGAIKETFQGDKRNI